MMMPKPHIQHCPRCRELIVDEKGTYPGWCVRILANGVLNEVYHQECWMAKIFEQASQEDSDGDD